MDENSFCRGRTDCISFAIFVSILFIAIIISYISKCLIYSSQPQNSPLPLTTSTSIIMQPNTPLSEHNPLYCHALKSIPLITYEPVSCSSSNDNDNDNDDKDFEDENCVICLAEFEKGEKVRVLPRCKHVYHVECIDQWLLRALHCPICRKRVVDEHHYLAKILATNRSVQIRINHNFPAASLMYV